MFQTHTGGQVSQTQEEGRHVFLCTPFSIKKQLVCYLIAYFAYLIAFHLGTLWGSNDGRGGVNSNDVWH